ncbi:MAG: alginate export family protein [bacterium]
MTNTRRISKSVFTVLVAQCAVLSAFAQYNMAEIISKAMDNAPVPEGQALSWDAGGDFRIRQEMYDNLPRFATQSHNESYFRMRARLWGKVENEDFTIYGRLADEFREYVTAAPRATGPAWNPRDYARTPGEVILDNLYLDARDLLWDRVDLRIGRQDLMYGAGRMIFEGTPMDGSRTFFFDAVKAVVKVTEKNTVDVLGFYNSPFTFGAGNPNPRGGGESLPLNSIETWSTGMAEWGGALYFKSKEVKQFPFEVYYIYAERSNYELFNGTDKQGRWINTVGLRLMPKITEEFSAEFEGAAQYGQKESGAEVGGHMAYLGLTYAPTLELLGTAKPYATLATLYLSGDPDKKRGTYNTGDTEDDRSWDPLWSRYTYFLSEMYAYQSYYGLCYWSNMIYPNLEVGSKWPNKHSVFTSFGPMYAAVEDGVGGGDGALYGYFWRARYDFPLWSKIFGKRGNIFGHVTLEALEPGDYSATDKLAYFARWEVSFAF